MWSLLDLTPVAGLNCSWVQIYQCLDGWEVPIQALRRFFLMLTRWRIQDECYFTSLVDVQFSVQVHLDSFFQQNSSYILYIQYLFKLLVIWTFDKAFTYTVLGLGNIFIYQKVTEKDKNIVYVVLRIESRIFNMLGKHSITELYPHSKQF